MFIDERLILSTYNTIEISNVFPKLPCQWFLVSLRQVALP